MVPLATSGSPDISDALAAQSGDKEAFVRLIRRQERSLALHLRQFTNNEAVLQDLRQETYLEAYRSLSTYKHRGSFASWLRQIASRVGYRYWKGRAKEAQAGAAYRELRQYCASSQATRRTQEDIDHVRELLACLGRCDSTLLELKYVKGLMASEIAGSLGWSVGRVRVRLHRAIKRLRSSHHPVRGN
jgi:RNA polymerase sigma-70 factor, ECF subfamily